MLALRAPNSLSAFISTQVSTAWNWALTENMVYRRGRGNGRWRRFAHFAGMNNLVLLARIPFMALLVGLLGMGAVLANAVTLVVTFVARYAFADRIIYRLPKTDGK